MPSPYSRRTATQRQNKPKIEPVEPAPGETVEMTDQEQLEVVEVDLQDRAKGTGGIEAPDTMDGVGTDQLASPDDQTSATSDLAGASELPAAAGRSGRRTARSTRRSSQSGKKSGPAVAARSARSKTLTPEQIAARRAAIRTGLIVAGGIALLAVLIVVIWFFAVRVDPAVKRADQTLTEARNAKDRAVQNIAGHQPDAAQTEYDTALKLLTNSVELGMAASDHPDPALVADVRRAQGAFALRTEVEGLKQRIDTLRRQLAVANRLRGLLDRFAKLQDIDDASLAGLERDIQAFSDNPVDLGGARNDSAIAEHDNAVGTAKGLLQPILRERDARTKARTSDRVRQAQAEIDSLVKQERYQEALSAVDQAERDWKDADFKGLRTTAVESHQKAWQAVSRFVETRRADATAPGATEATKAAARADVRARLQKVIDTWGVESSVTQAKEWMTQFQD